MNTNLAAKSSVVAVVLSKVPLVTYAFTVNSSGNPPSRSAIVPSVLLVCLKSTLISIASPTCPFSTNTGSTFMITQLSTVIPSVTFPSAPVLAPHQLLLANRVPLV